MNQTSPSKQSNGVHQQSELRLINSENLTLSMAVTYLFQWRTKQKFVEALLERIIQFEQKEIIQFIPSIIFIMSLQSNCFFEKFFQDLAIRSLPLYLIIKWSYCAYWKEGEDSDIIISKLDSSLLSKQKMDSDHFDERQLAKRLKEKEKYCQYMGSITDFYERLFKIPIRLKKHAKENRNKKLKEYLDKAISLFWKNENILVNGIPFPIDVKSPFAVTILNDHCFTFSTKERVPFKIVVETVNFQDLLLIKKARTPSQKFVEEESEKKKAPLILPQSYFGEEWRQIEKRIKEISPYRKYESYRIKSFMVKSGDDLRQQYMAMQLIKIIEDISIKENLKIWVKSYLVIPFNKESGLIEFVNDTKTVSFLKEKSGEKSLRRIYQQIFGDNLEESITNFIQSLAGYSLAQYLFQIKDRHNNNILIDTYGHLIHIDFSFMISSSPGNMGFERAPFKFTQDYLDLMEGEESDIFAHFRMLFFLGLKYIRKYKKQIMDTVMMMSHCDEMKCFQKFQKQEMEKRFHEHATDEELEKIVDNIVKYAARSYTTSNYDRFQWFTNQIYS